MTDPSCSWPEDDGLVVAAAAASVQLARCLNDDELALLSAFLTILGDNLALIAAQRAARAARQSGIGDCPGGTNGVE